MLCSIVGQLLTQADHVPKIIKKLFDKFRHTFPPLADLLPVVKRLLQTPGEYFIIIDALDECSLQECQRQILCDGLKEICGWQLSNLHLLLTSRREADLLRTLDPLVTIPPVSIQAEVIASDILKYVRSELVGHERLQKWPENVKREIEDIIVAKSDGM